MKIEKFVDDNELNNLFCDIQKCKRCELYKIPVNIFTESGGGKVVGRGNKRAKIMFIGQNPYGGFRAGNKLFAFTGKAGKFLNQMLGKIDIPLNMCYFTNLVKCSTLKNEIPSLDIQIKCNFWLSKEIEIIQPKLIVLLGSMVKNYFGIYKTYELVDLCFGDKKYHCFTVPHPSWFIYKDSIKNKNEFLYNVKTMVDKYVNNI